MLYVLGIVNQSLYTECGLGATVNVTAINILQLTAKNFSVKFLNSYFTQIPFWLAATEFNIAKKLWTFAKWTKIHWTRELTAAVFLETKTVDNLHSLVNKGV